MATKIIVQCDICKKEIADNIKYAKIRIRTYRDTRMSEEFPDIETVEDVCGSCLTDFSNAIIKLKEEKYNGTF